jgi:multidrug efflux pump subunit AcrA (membrane-fusion protein)
VRLRSSWHLLLLGLVGAGIVLAAVLELGPPTSSARTSREVVTAAKGVVQSMVSGTGNVEPGTDVEANFQTSGTLQHLYAKVGDHVVKGQLLASLDPTAAQNTLDQAEASLTSAEDQLTNAEQATVTTSTSEPVGSSSSVQYVVLRPTQTTTTTASTTGSTTTTTSVTPTTTTTSTAPTTTTAATTTPSRGGGAGGSASGSSGAPGSTGASGSSSSGSSSASSSGETAATKAANIASAQASVDGAQASVTTAETALHETHLYAPASGTIVLVQSISPGDQVSSSSSSSGSSSSAGASSAGSSTATTSAGSLGSTSASTSSSGLVEIVNTSKMTMTVAFSESDISKIKVGQAATVTLEALTGVELAAHVSSVSTLGTTSSSVVSYDATLSLDQRDSKVKPGMSASASVITGQAQGVTLPNSAVAGTGSLSTVNQLHNGKTSSTRVVVGLRGDSRTQVVSGLSAGDQVVVTTTLPSLSASSSSSSSGSSGSSGTLGTGATGRARFGGAGGFGAGGFAGGGGVAGGGPPG